MQIYLRLPMRSISRCRSVFREAVRTRAESCGPTRAEASLRATLRRRSLLQTVLHFSAGRRPARLSRGCYFATFCHQKVVPKVSARHLRRDRTAALAERARKTPLFAAQKDAPLRLWRLGKVRKRPLPSPATVVRTPAPGVRTAVRSVSACGALRRLRCVSRNDDFSCCYLFWQAVGLRNSAM